MVFQTILLSITSMQGFLIMKRIGPLAALIAALVYLLALFLSAISNTTENLSASFYSEFLIQITCQHLLLLVGFDTLIYRKYYDTSPILVGHHLCLPLLRWTSLKTRSPSLKTRGLTFLYSRMPARGIITSAY